MESPHLITDFTSADPKACNWNCLRNITLCAEYRVTGYSLAWLPRCYIQIRDIGISFLFLFERTNGADRGKKERGKGDKISSDLGQDSAATRKKKTDTAPDRTGQTPEVFLFLVLFLLSSSCRNQGQALRARVPVARANHFPHTPSHPGRD